MASTASKKSIKARRSANRDKRKYNHIDSMLNKRKRLKRAHQNEIMLFLGERQTAQI